MRDPRKVAAFDMDMTLTTAEAADFHLRCFDKTLKEVLGIDVDMKNEVDYPGKTDIGVMMEAAKIHGKLHELVKKKEEVKSVLRKTFEEGIGSVSIELMPGVRPVLDYLSNETDAVLTLMTGNSSSIARAKLEKLGIANYFVLGIGGYGDDFEDRSDIAKDLVKKSEAYIKMKFGENAEVYVFDDTPRGVKAATEAGARGIGVMSGYTKNQNDFAPYKPLIVLKSLEQLDELKRIFPPSSE